MTAHLGDVLLTLFVVTMGILLSYSLHDESFFGFDDFHDVLQDSNSGDYEREHAHIIILQAVGVWLSSKSNWPHNVFYSTRILVVFPSVG